MLFVPSTQMKVGNEPSNTPLNRGSLTSAVIKATYSQARLLLQAGADVNVTTERGESPLILATTNVHDPNVRTKLVVLLLKHGANPNLQDSQGQTALMHAAILGHLEVCTALVEHNKTELGIQDKEGNTALMYAAAFGHTDIVSLFITVFKELRKHINLQQKNNQDLGACQLASRNGHEECVRLLTRDAQLFPSAMPEGFPDPSDLDRAPTPTRRRQNKKEMTIKSKKKNLSVSAKKYVIEVENNLQKVRSDSIESVGLSGNEADTESVAVSAAVRSHSLKKKQTTSVNKGRNNKLLSASPSALLTDDGCDKLDILPSSGRASTPRENFTSLPKLNLNSSISSTKSESGAFRLARGRNKASGKSLNRRATSEPRVQGTGSDSSSEDPEGDELQDFLMSSCRSEPWMKIKSGKSGNRSKNSSVKLPPIRVPCDLKIGSANGGAVKTLGDVIDEEEHETSASSENDKNKFFKKRQIRRKTSHHKTT